MPDYNHDLAELRDLLEKADVMRRWSRGQAFTVNQGTRVEFKVELAIRHDAHARPPGTVFELAEVELDFKARGEDLAEIENCSAQVVVDGVAADGSTVRRFAMHFDRHPSDQPGTDLHAAYHWQVGGSRFDGWHLGDVLMLQGPRFPSHPLDPILLVDFVLGHFHGAKRAELLTAKFVRYRRLLHRSQQRLIRPFFSSISRALEADKFQETELWPSLCGPVCPVPRVG